VEYETGKKQSCEELSTRFIELVETLGPVTLIVADGCLQSNIMQLCDVLEILSRQRPDRLSKTLYRYIMSWSPRDLPSRGLYL